MATRTLTSKGQITIPKGFVIVSAYERASVLSSKSRPRDTS